MSYKYAYCEGLTSIEIPSSVTSIGESAFSGCYGLTSVVSCIAAEDLFAPGDYAFGGMIMRLAPSTCPQAQRVHTLQPSSGKSLKILSRLTSLRSRPQATPQCI